MIDATISRVRMRDLARRPSSRPGDGDLMGITDLAERPRSIGAADRRVW